LGHLQIGTEFIILISRSINGFLIEWWVKLLHNEPFPWDFINHVLSNYILIRIQFAFDYSWLVCNKNLFKARHLHIYGMSDQFWIGISGLYLHVKFGQWKSDPDNRLPLPTERINNPLEAVIG
jgi:hypothetical protein